MGGDRHRCDFPATGYRLLGVSTASGLAWRLAAGSAGVPAIAFALKFPRPQGNTALALVYQNGGHFRRSRAI